ncbi:caspase family protein [Pelagicoccus enzymogenes]|uniref:caspase family protein n=1 Tax=Pelagicoccus enzymogenes TaxID=2773457 RepID=UPI002811765F|nr:caspase family protein [Pelagicoccus enzymogenes]
MRSFTLKLLLATAIIAATTLAQTTTSRPRVSALNPANLAIFPAPDDAHFLTLNASGAHWWQSKSGKILSTITLEDGTPVLPSSNALLSPDGSKVYTATASHLLRIQLPTTASTPQVSAIALPSIDRLAFHPNTGELIAIDHDTRANLNRIHRVDTEFLAVTALPDIPITLHTDAFTTYGPLLNLLPSNSDAPYLDHVINGVGLTQAPLETAVSLPDAYRERNLQGLVNQWTSHFDSHYVAPGGALIHLFQPTYDIGYIAFTNRETLESDKIIFLEPTSYPHAYVETFVGPLQLAPGHNYHVATHSSLFVEGTRIFVLDLAKQEISFQTDLRHFEMARDDSSAAFSADGKSLFIANAFRFFRLDIASNQIVADYLPQSPVRIQKLALNATQSGYLVLDDQRQLSTLTLDANGAQFEKQYRSVGDFTLQADTASLFTLYEPKGSRDIRFNFWLADSYPDGQPVRGARTASHMDQTGPYQAIFSPAGSYVFTTQGTGALLDAFSPEKIFILPRDRKLYDSPIDSQTPPAASIDQNEAYLTVFENQRLSTFDFHSQEHLWSIDIPQDRRVYPLFYNYENQLLALHTNPYQLTLHDAETGAATPFPGSNSIPSTQTDPTYLQVSHDRQHLILGDAQKTHILNLDTGKTRTTLDLPSRNVAFALSPQSDFLLAATASGPIEFYSLDQARNIGELTVYPETNDWTFVASDHRFESSPNAADTLYTVIDRKIVPGGQLLAQLHEPGLLQTILGGDLPSRAATQIEGLASLPQVSLALADGTRGLIVEDDLELDTENATATLTLRASGANLLSSEPRLYHNGKLLGSSTRGLTVEDDEEGSESYLSKNYTVPLLPGKNRFRAVVVTASGIESFPASLTLNARGQAHSNTTSGIALHTLIVGANQYQNPKYNLNYAAADAEAFSKALQAKAANIFTRIDTHLLLDSDATRSNILATFKEIADSATARDVFIFYYAGHGVVDETQDKQFYLAPVNVTQLYGDPVHLVQNGISAQQLRQLSANIAAQKQLFLIDACQSAEALVTIAQRGAAEEKAIAQLARSTGTHWLTASGSQQFATEAAELGHGLFTHALLQALEGAADAGDKRITINELKAYLETQVPQLSQQYRGSAQYPSSYGTGQDFPIAIIP